VQLHRYFENDYSRELAWDQLKGYRDRIFRETIERIGEQVRCGRLLDVGCGCGFLLREAQARGWAVTGLDPSRDSIDYLNAMLGSVGMVGTLEDFDPGERYDVITMINVLDHLIDPWEDVRRAAALLRHGGLLYLRLPNGRFHGTLLRFLRFWGLGGKARHLVVFHNYSMSPSWLARMLADKGLTGIAIRNTGLSECNGYRRREGRTQALHLLRHAVWCGTKSVEHLSVGRLLWGPSLEVVARKEENAG
jgi:SAM-dependent methyltransferase